MSWNPAGAGSETSAAGFSLFPAPRLEGRLSMAPRISASRMSHRPHSDLRQDRKKRIVQAWASGPRARRGGSSEIKQSAAST